MKILVPLDGSKLSELAIPTAQALRADRRATVILARVVDASEVRETVADNPDPDFRRARPDPEYVEGRVDPILGGFMPEPSPPDWSHEAAQAGERIRTEAGAYLEAISQQYFGGDAEVVVLEGEDPGEAIIELARECRPDVIVMGTHGRTGLARVIMGSVAKKVSGSDVSRVLMVRRGEATEAA